MGQEVCAAVEAEPDLELAEEVDVGLSSLDALVESEAQVAVDFTNAAAASENIPWCMKNGIHVVVGSSGIPASVVADIEQLAPKCEGNVLIAPNFAIGAVLMMKFAEMAAPWFETAEIVELHHDAKVDAPSGTAMMTARRMLAASDQWADDPTRTFAAEGARGGDVGPIHVHAVRLRGLMAHHEVLFGTTGQMLTIRHDSIDRGSFMPGVLLACKEIANHRGLTVGLEPFLGLDAGS